MLDGHEAFAQWFYRRHWRSSCQKAGSTSGRTCCRAGTGNRWFGCTPRTARRRRTARRQSRKVLRKLRKLRKLRQQRKLRLQRRQRRKAQEAEEVVEEAEEAEDGSLTSKVEASIETLVEPLEALLLV